MAGSLVRPLVRDVRRVDERVAAPVVLGAPPRLQLLADDRQVGQPEHEAAPELLVDPEELEVATERPVVTALDLLQPLEIRVELRLRRPDRAVDPLQLGVVLVAAPVRAGDRHELERTDLPGALDVRPAAEIDEVVVPVRAHPAVLDRLVELLDLVDLVVLMPLAEQPEGVGDVQLIALEGQVLPDHRPHPLFDPGEVIRLQRSREIEVVVEAVGDGRPEPELRVGEQLEHGAGHDMRGGMAQRVQRIVAVVRLARRLQVRLRGHLVLPRDVITGTRRGLAVPPSFPARAARSVGRSIPGCTGPARSLGGGLPHRGSAGSHHPGSLRDRSCCGRCPRLRSTK